MEARSRSRSDAVLRSQSPTPRFNSPSSSSSAFNFAIHRTLSPTHAKFIGGGSFSSSSAAASSPINFALDRSASQFDRSARRPISPKGRGPVKPIPSTPPKKTCMCSPTNHPGSFRCSIHRNINNSTSSTHSQLNARRSAMTNSLVRIGGVEGEWVRRALTALIRPSSHHMRRRTSFQPRPSRLCYMTTAQDAS